MKIPPSELQRAETKCNLLSFIEEDFRYVIADLEQRYGTQVRISVIRTIFGGGAGPKQIVLQELEDSDGETPTTNKGPLNNTADSVTNGTGIE